MSKKEKHIESKVETPKAAVSADLNFEEPTPEEIEAIAFDFITKGRSFREIRGLTQENMESIYAVGFTLYNNGRFEDSEKVFQFLAVFDHMVRKYWMALAGAQQMLKKYHKAIDAYSYAAMLDMFEPWAPFYAAECYLALKDEDKAKKALDSALDVVGNDKDLKDRIQGMLSLLNKK